MGDTMMGSIHRMSCDSFADVTRALSFVCQLAPQANPVDTNNKLFVHLE